MTPEMMTQQAMPMIGGYQGHSNSLHNSLQQIYLTNDASPHHYTAGYLNNTEQWLTQDVLARVDMNGNGYSLPFAQRGEVRSITSVPFSFGAIFSSIKNRLSFLPSLLTRLTKRIVFLVSVPVYWFLVFRHVLGYFDMGIFTFVVGISYVLSTVFFNHWGILEWGMKS